MENIIASEIQPNGIDEEIINHLESNKLTLSLAEAILRISCF